MQLNKWGHKLTWTSKVKVIHWSWSKVTQIQLSLETVRLIEAKFHVEPPWDGRTKVCSNGPGHMTSVVAMLIYGKNLKKSYGTKRLMTLKVGMQHQELEYYQVVLMMTLGWPWPILRPDQIWSLMLLYRKSGKTMDFSETIICLYQSW